MVDQRRQIVLPLAQRRQRDGEDRQAVIEILAESPGVHLDQQVAVGGGDDADVGAAGPHVPDALISPLLQDTQQLGLQLRRQLAHLVEEQGAAFRRLEAPDAIARRPGERAADVPEELRLCQLARNGRAVELDEGATGTWAQTMNGARGQLLSGARLTQNQHAGVGGGHGGDLAAHLAHRSALADQLVDRAQLRGGMVDLTEQSTALEQDLLAHLRDLRDGAGGGDGCRGVIGHDAQHVHRRVGDGRPDEHAQHAEPFAPTVERQPGEAGDLLGPHPLRSSDLGIAGWIGDDDGSAGGRHGAHLERSDRDAAKVAVQAIGRDGRPVERARRAGHQMQTTRAIAAGGGVGTAVALIAGIDQPQARQRDVLVLGQALGHERQKLVERVLVGELQQQLFEGVRSGRADLRPQHGTSLRERSFRKRKFAVENTRSALRWPASLPSRNEPETAHRLSGYRPRCLALRGLGFIEERAHAG